ncbi:hypothetical protein D7X98_17640, partial [bacterium 1XD8-76]
MVQILYLVSSVTCKHKICPASYSVDGQIYGKGYPFPMLAPQLLNLKDTERKGKEWNGNQKSRTAAICRKKGSRQKKLSVTKSAAHTMKCLPPAAARNGSATR